MSKLISNWSDLKLMYLNITDNCNLKCRYCYDENSRINSEKKKISLDCYKQLADDSKLLGLEYVVITGGEPLINKNWFDISQMFYDNGIKVKISTNGTLLTQDVAKKIKSINAIVQVSLDGDEEVMEFVTQVKGTYNKVLNAIDILNKYNIKFNLNAVIGKHNLNNIDFLNDISKEMNFKIRISFYNDVYNDSKGIIKSLDISEIDKTIFKINYMRRENKNIFMDLPPLLTPENIEPTYNPGCGWAKHVVGILSSGDVTLCGLASCMPELVAGNIGNDSFLNIWNNSELFNKLRTYGVDDLQGICRECPVNYICLGYCRLESYKREKSFCGGLHLCEEYYKAMLDGRIKKTKFPSNMLEIV